LIHAMKNELMDIIFQNDLQPYVFDYLDDIIIIGTSFQHQIDLIKVVAKRLREANLTVNLNKVHANLSRIKILGNILDKDGLHADPVKVKAMSRYPVPRNAKDMKRFLGVSGWFSRFIQNYSAIVPPLSKLLKKNVKFIWGPEEQDAFDLFDPADPYARVKPQQVINGTQNYLQNGKWLKQSQKSATTCIEYEIEITSKKRSVSRTSRL
jgi:hypothetical protein